MDLLQVDSPSEAVDFSETCAAVMDRLHVNSPPEVTGSTSDMALGPPNTDSTPGEALGFDGRYPVELLRVAMGPAYADSPPDVAMGFVLGVQGAGLLDRE